MSPRELARRARDAYPMHAVAPCSTVRHLRRGWIRSVTILGDKWKTRRPWTREDQRRIEEVAA